MYSKNISVENLFWLHRMLSHEHTNEEVIEWCSLAMLQEALYQKLYKPTTLKQLLYGN